MHLGICDAEPRAEVFASDSGVIAVGKFRSPASSASADTALPIHTTANAVRHIFCHIFSPHFRPFWIVFLAIFFFAV
jgi:hypothetical protein